MTPQNAPPDVQPLEPSASERIDALFTWLTEPITEACADASSKFLRTLCDQGLWAEAFVDWSVNAVIGAAFLFVLWRIFRRFRRAVFKDPKVEPVQIAPATSDSKGILRTYLTHQLEAFRDISGDRRARLRGRSLAHNLPENLAFLDLRARPARPPRATELEFDEDSEPIPVSEVITRTMVQASEDGPETPNETLCIGLFGGPGSGKSTVSRHAFIGVAQQWLKESLRSEAHAPFYPVWMEFPDLPEDGAGSSDMRLSVAHHIVSALSLASPDAPAANSVERVALATELAEALGKTPIFLILDAVDQEPALKRRGERLKRVRGWKARRDLVLLTCRTQADLSDEGSRSIVPWAQNWQLSEVDWPEMGREFIAHWRAAYNDRNDTHEPLREAWSAGLIEAIDEKVEEDERYLDIVQVPLLLDLTCRVYLHPQILPGSRRELYKSYVNQAVKEWDRERPKRPKFTGLTVELLHEFTATLAFFAHREGYTGGTSSVAQGAIPETALRRCAAEWLETGPEKGRPALSPDDLLAFLNEDLGYLIRLTDRNAFRFTHDSFQAFLAAEHASRQGRYAELAGEIGEESFQSGADPRWRLVFSFFREADDLGTLAALLERTDGPGLLNYRGELQELERLDLSGPGRRALLALADYCRRQLGHPSRTPRERALASIWLHRIRTRLGHRWAFAEIRNAVQACLDADDELGAAHWLMFLAEIEDSEERSAAIEWLEAALPAAPTDAERLAYLNHCRALALSMLGLGWALPDKPADAVSEERARIFLFLLAEIPGGTFIRGSEQDGDNPRTAGARTPAFQIARFPLTRAQYRCFRQTAAAQAYEDIAPDNWDDPDRIHPAAPVVDVDWFQARAAAQSFVGNPAASLPAKADRENAPYLPSEDLWERAARGIDGRDYPWGDWDEDDSSSRHCNIDESGIGQPSPVVAFPQGASPDPAHCYEMSGNVFDWTGNRDTRVRGGAFYRGRHYARCAYRYSLHPDLRVVNYGFRPARTDFKP